MHPGPSTGRQRPCSSTSLLRTALCLLVSHQPVQHAAAAGHHRQGGAVAHGGDDLAQNQLIHDRTAADQGAFGSRSRGAA